MAPASAILTTAPSHPIPGGLILHIALNPRYTAFSKKPNGEPVNTVGIVMTN